MSLSVLSAIFDDIVRVVHYDGELLHIFMRSTFNQADLVFIRRIFSTKEYLPDRVLHDILITQQGVFLTREILEEGILETCYDKIESYEGPVDYTELEPVLRSAGVMNRKDYCALVYKVGSAPEETLTQGVTEEDLQIEVVGSKKQFFNSFLLARSMVSNRALLRENVMKIERASKKRNPKR